MSVWKYQNKTTEMKLMARLHTEIPSSKQWETQRNSGFKLQFPQNSWHRCKQLTELRFFPLLSSSWGLEVGVFIFFFFEHEVYKPKLSPFQLLAALIIKSQKMSYEKLRIKLFHVSFFDYFSYPLLLPAHDYIAQPAKWSILK